MKYQMEIRHFFQKNLFTHIKFSKLTPPTMNIQKEKEKEKKKKKRQNYKRRYLTSALGLWRRTWSCENPAESKNSGNGFLEKSMHRVNSLNSISKSATASGPFNSTQPLPPYTLATDKSPCKCRVQFQTQKFNLTTRNLGN